MVRRAKPIYLGTWHKTTPNKKAEYIAAGQRVILDAYTVNNLLVRGERCIEVEGTLRDMESRLKFEADALTKALNRARYLRWIIDMLLDNPEVKPRGNVSAAELYDQIRGDRHE